MTNKPGAALVDDYLRRAREGSHSYAVVPLEALKIACADLDAARERIADLESQLNAIAARAHK